MSDPLQLDANVIIQKLQNQIGSLAGTIALLEAQIETMQKMLDEQNHDHPDGESELNL